MPVKYDIEIPERVIKALGLSGKTIFRVISMGLSGIFKRKENPFAL